MLKTDKLIKSQAIQRHQEIETRRNQEQPIFRGLGNTVTGTIYDCNRKHFERVLRAYSDRLYLGWNPYKKDGQGCWEVWHRPTYKTPIYRGEFEGVAYYSLEYKPNDYEHWVADLDYLDYAFIGKLREMDAWENKQLIADHDNQIDAIQAKKDKEESEYLKYIVKSNKSAFRDLLDYTQSGFNPLDFFTKGK